MKGRIYGLKDDLLKFYQALVSIFHVYEDPIPPLLSILPVYKINSRRFVKIRNSNIILPIKSRKSLYNIISLSYYLYLFRNAYEIHNSQIQIRLSDQLVQKINPYDAIEDDCLMLKIKVLLALKKSGAVTMEYDEKHYLINFENLQWFARKDVPSDIFLGPFLTVLHERYVAHQWFYKYIGKVRTFIDIGANVGGYSLRASKYDNVKEVIAFEPDIGNFSLLKRNIEANKLDKIVCMSVALGESEGEMPLYNGLGLLNRGTINLVGRGDKIGTVKVVPFDSVIEYFEEPALVKIDTEGFEEKVLRGMTESLKNIDILIIEMWKYNKFLVKFLNKFGFKVKDSFKDSYLFVKNN